jgi:hypothetical protein
VAAGTAETTGGAPSESAPALLLLDMGLTEEAQVPSTALGGATGSVLNNPTVLATQEAIHTWVMGARIPGVIDFKEVHGTIHGTRRAHMQRPPLTPSCNRRTRRR